MPIAANCHGPTPAKIPWVAADAARMPSRKAPLTLTTTVPQGNVSPTRRATKPDSQNLAVPPSTLPRATHITPLIVSTACLCCLSSQPPLKPCAEIPPLQPVTRTTPDVRGTRLLDFALRPRRP